MERVEKVWGIFLSFSAHSSEPGWPLTLHVDNPTTTLAERICRLCRKTRARSRELHKTNHLRWCFLYGELSFLSTCTDFSSQTSSLWVYSDIGISALSLSWIKTKGLIKVPTRRKSTGLGAPTMGRHSGLPFTKFSISFIHPLSLLICTDVVGNFNQPHDDTTSPLSRSCFICPMRLTHTATHSGARCPAGRHLLIIIVQSQQRTCDI